MQYQPTDKMIALFPDFEKIVSVGEQIGISHGQDTLFYLDTQKALELGLIEPVPEKPKSVWGLRPFDECYLLNGDWEIFKIKWSCGWGKQRLNNSIFLTEKEADHERIRRQMRAKAWKPDIATRYFYYDSDTKTVLGTTNTGTYVDILSIHAGLAFPTRAACEEAMTQEVKEAFNLV